MSSPAEGKTRKEAPPWVIIVMLVVFVGWGYEYLFVLRPIMNAWLAQYISGYPAILHVFPILAVPILVAMPLGWLFGKDVPVKPGQGGGGAAP
jgi:hypothetical protein